MKIRTGILFSILLGTVSSVFAERPACNRFDAFWNDASAAFSVNGNVATMNGVINGTTPGAVRALLANHPNVDTIHLDYVPGSSDDEANLEAARLIRNAGLATHIVANGLVASGGVDFFLAGVTRTIDPAICEFGVHSWGGGDVENPAALPRTAKEHRLYLRYYREIGISDDFYFYTLRAADADNIYNMDDNEIAQFGLTGAAINPSPVRPDILIGKKRRKLVGDNRYSGGRGQALSLRLKGRRSAKYHFAIENDSDFFDYCQLERSRLKRGITGKTFRISRGRKNITAKLRTKRYQIPSVKAGENVRFVTKLRKNSSDLRVRQNIKHRISSTLQGSRRDSVVAKVRGRR